MHTLSTELNFQETIRPQSSGLPDERTKETIASRRWSLVTVPGTFSHLHGCKCFALQGLGMMVGNQGGGILQDHPRMERQVSRVPSMTGVENSEKKESIFRIILKE